MVIEGLNIKGRHASAAIAILVALSIALIALAGYINIRLEESGERQFLAYSERTASFMGERARYVRSALASFTVETDDPAQLQDALSRLQQSYGFTKVGFAGLDGTGINADGSPFSLADVTREETALSKGLSSYSPAYVSAEGSYVHLAQVPLFIDGTQVGALYAQVPLALFLSGGDAGCAPGYAELASCQELIFDGQTGEIMASSIANEPLAAPGSSMYDYVEQVLLGQRPGTLRFESSDRQLALSAADLRAETAAGRSAIVVGQLDGVESYLCVAPTGNGSWYAASIAPVSSIRAEANLVKAVFTAMFLLSLICVSLAAVVAIVSHRRQARERHVEMRRRLYEALSDSVDMAVNLYAPKTGHMTPIVAKDTDVLGESLEMLVRKPEQAQRIGMSEEGRAMLDLIRQGGSAELISGSFSLLIDGIEARYVDYSLRPLFYEGADQLLIIMRDVTEEHSLQRSMKAAMEVAEAANLAKSEFLSRMSHEIRTPMNVIIGMLRIARTHLDDPKRLAENLDHIDNASTHLLDLINEVLDIAKIESGKYAMDNAPFNLMGMLKSLNEVIEPQCHAKGHRYTFTACGPVDATFLGDEMSLRQVLVNLLTNAVKYTPEGGHISLTVSVVPSLAVGYQRIIFTVSDDGIGMAEPYLEHLYEPFVVEGRSDAQGTGLGMPIVRNIVNAMGGDIHVESRLDEGTTFTVAVNKRLLDAADAKSAGSREAHRGEPTEGADTPAETPATADLAGVHVLVVEDSPINAEIASELLRAEGMNVTWARDGREACELFSQSAPGTFDLVLMDVRMPRMDGHEATRAIRAMHRDDAKRIPIIAMSANAFVDDVLASLKSGMNAHLSKPIDLAELLATIARELGRP